MYHAQGRSMVDIIRKYALQLVKIVIKHDNYKIVVVKHFKNRYKTSFVTVFYTLLFSDNILYR